MAVWRLPAGGRRGALQERAATDSLWMSQRTAAVARRDYATCRLCMPAFSPFPLCYGLYGVMCVLPSLPSPLLVGSRVCFIPALRCVYVPGGLLCLFPGLLSPCGLLPPMQEDPCGTGEFVLRVCYLHILRYALGSFLRAFLLLPALCLCGLVRGGCTPLYRVLRHLLPLLVNLPHITYALLAFVTCCGLPTFGYALRGLLLRLTPSASPHSASCPACITRLCCWFAWRCGHKTGGGCSGADGGRTAGRRESTMAFPIQHADST